MESKIERYQSIEGLRAIGAIGIIFMHIRDNSTYNIDGIVYNIIIPPFVNFVFVFMTISAFGLCCGYFEKAITSKIQYVDFYKRRCMRILPFFSVLVILEISYSRTVQSLCEGIIELTLLFGYLPDLSQLSVVGVGWFVGLIFVFYIFFPFFCFLIRDKRNAWVSFVLSVLCNFIVAFFFNVRRANILYSLCFFILGGIIYHYRIEIAKINRLYALFFMIIVIVLHYIVGGNTVIWLLCSGSLLIYAVSSSNSKTLLRNSVVCFIGEISMEIYLSHMFIFRVLEKARLNGVLGNGWGQYLFMVSCVLGGAILFSFVTKKCISIVNARIKK